MAAGYSGSLNSECIEDAMAATLSTPMRSVRRSGPIGCAQPLTIPASMSAGDAKPDSTIRTAESRYGTSSAFTMKPALSGGADHRLPGSPSARPRTVASTSAEVGTDGTTSTSRSTGIGLKKCMPIT